MGAPDLAGFGVTFKVWVFVNHVSDGFIRHIQIFGNVACGDFHALCGQHVYCGFQTVAAPFNFCSLGLRAFIARW